MGDARNTTPPEEASRSVTAYCRHCNAVVGTFFNSWIKVTGSYYLPSLVGSYHVTGLTVSDEEPKMVGSTNALEDCDILPLHCSNPDCRPETLGFLVDRAPDSKRSYSGRELFKLRKLSLKSDLTGRDVEPLVEAIATEPELSNPHSELGSLALKSTELDVRLPSMASVASRNHSFPISSVLDSHSESRYSPHPGPADVVSSLKKRVSASTTPMSERPNSYRSISIAPAEQTRHVHSYNSSHHSNKMLERDILPPIGGSRSSANLPPSALEVKLEALDRLQTQVNLNRATLETQSKDIHRLHDSLQLVQHDIRTVWEAVERLTQELRTRPQVSSAITHAASSDRVDDALDLMAAQVAAIQQKTTEIDQLKLQVELMRRKLNRQTQNESTPAPAYGTSREAILHHTPVQQVPHREPGPSAGRSSSQQIPQRAVSQSYTPDVSHAQIVDQASGWATVNPNKRPHANGADARTAFESPLTSPKRMKLAPIEPRYSYDSAAGQHYPRDGTMAADSHALSTRANSPQFDSSFIPYTAHKEKTDAQPKPPGSSGRGRGRPRKNPPTDQFPAGLERDPWVSSQMANDSSYQYGGTPGSRRSSVGYVMGLPLGSQLSSSQAQDPYAHTKRTRSKPIRNSDGVLIRKDGRPDMRSQSSAANLRKVHARKNEERREWEAAEHPPSTEHRTYSGLSTVESSAAQSPTSESPVSPHPLLVHSPTGQPTKTTDRPPPNKHDQEDSGSKDITEAMINTPERTEKILKKMFPQGIQEERKRLAITNHFFQPDNPKPAEPRAQAVAKELHQGIQALAGNTNNPPTNEFRHDNRPSLESDDDINEVARPVPIAPMMIKQEEQSGRATGPELTAA